MNKYVIGSKHAMLCDYAIAKHAIQIESNSLCSWNGTTQRLVRFIDSLGGISRFHLLQNNRPKNGRKENLVDRLLRAFSPRSHSMMKSEIIKYHSNCPYEKWVIHSACYCTYTFFKCLSSADIISSYVLRVLYRCWFSSSFVLLFVSRRTRSSFVRDCIGHEFSHGAPHTHAYALHSAIVNVS